MTIRKSVKNSIRSYRGMSLENKDIKLGDKKSKKNNIIYLKQRYSKFYKEMDWDKAEKYNNKALEMYGMDLRNWYETKEQNKQGNLNVFGFKNKRKTKYG